MMCILFFLLLLLFFFFQFGFFSFFFRLSCLISLKPTFSSSRFPFYYLSSHPLLPPSPPASPHDSNPTFFPIFVYMAFTVLRCGLSGFHGIGENISPSFFFSFFFVTWGY